MNRKKINKQVQRNFNIVLALFSFLFLAVLMNQLIDQLEQKEPISYLSNHVSDDVQKYTPMLEQELAQLDLDEYAVVLAAIMQQESKGKGGDPMQASESAGLSPNSIKDPQQSIKQGVKHFQDTLAYGNQKGVDFATVIQAYNMGMGYIDYVAGNGGKHSEEIAKEFSYIQVQNNPSLYNCGGDQSNFRYPYCYGDFTYSTKVSKNIETLIATNSDT
jgi:hypothetical protein